MRIHQFSRILAFPFVLWFAGVLYVTMKNQDYDLSYWIIPPFVIIAIIFVMAPQVDYWWLKRHPVPLESEVIEWLQKNLPFYNGLTPVKRAEFERRLSLFTRIKSFTAMGKKQENVPEDVKIAIGHAAIVMTLGRESFLFGEVDRYIVYKHPFPSPRFKFLHTVETQIEDGVVILSLEHLYATIVNENYYHIGFHAFAELFVKQNPKYDWEALSHLDWSDVEKISSFTEQNVLATIGFPSVDLVIVFISLYFSHQAVFKERYPKESAFMEEVFNPSGI